MSRPYRKRSPDEPVTRWLPYGGVTWVRHYPSATGVIVAKNDGRLFAWTVSRTSGVSTGHCDHLSDAKKGADDEARKGSAA